MEVEETEVLTIKSIFNGEGYSSITTKEKFKNFHYGAKSAFTME